MNLATGTTLGPYELVSPLGAGGMGEVYGANDTRLNRDVAIKVLPTSFANDADRLLRFEQEARATSALNHPNILTVYDIGSHEGSPYIVAELLEGEELRRQLSEGALPQRKAVDYAQQIASGLAAAHLKGIIHHDLKPENIFITTDGRVKILDFGLAKLKPAKQAAGASSELATQKAFTDPGVVMGTVGYMSPEQVRGQEADHRSDIFSFGAILYEMLRGRRTFTGESAIEVMNAILKEEPEELTETNARINPALERIVRRCLEKKVERRETFTSLAVSPDGRSLVYGTSTEGKRGLWVRPLASLTAQPLPGTDKAVPEAMGFWSPDSRYIAFFADGKLKKREIAGGPAQTLADALIPRGGSWNRDDVIIFSPTPGPLYRVSATGGEATQLATLDESR